MTNSNDEIYNSSIIKIISSTVDIKEKPIITSNNIGVAYQNEVFDILNIIEDDKFIWYYIKTSSNINGYIAFEKPMIEIIPYNINSPGKIADINNMYSLLFTCSKEDYYYLKIYEGESLYIKKQSN